MFAIAAARGGGPYSLDRVTGKFIYLSGLPAVLGGPAIVNVHNSWNFDWRVIIMALGWLMLIEGIVRIILPDFADYRDRRLRATTCSCRCRQL